MIELFIEILKAYDEYLKNYVNSVKDEFERLLLDPSIKQPSLTCDNSNDGD